MADFSTKPTRLSHTHTYTHTHTHTPLLGPLFPSLILPILHLPSLIRGHLLSFLPASPGFSSPSLIGEFLQVSDWPVISAPPLVNTYENTSPFFRDTPSISSDRLLL